MEKYADIIFLPHHVSSRHPQMSMAARAAQFAPFAALTGYDDEIAETARLTDRRIELTEAEQAELSRRLSALRLPADVELTWFVPDSLKDGGRYTCAHVTVKRIWPEQGVLLLTDGRRIPLGDILDIEADEGRDGA